MVRGTKAVLRGRCCVAIGFGKSEKCTCFSSKRNKYFVHADLAQVRVGAIVHNQMEKADKVDPAALASTLTDQST